jgi:CRP-like cAMP-binding protein
MQRMESGRGFWNLLTSDEQRVLWALGWDKKYPPGAMVCVEGDPATHVFILVRGWVKILSSTDGGHETVLALRGEGDIVGEIAGATAGHRNAAIQAIDAVHALIVGYDRFNSFLDTHPDSSHAYRRMMTQRLSDIDATLRRRMFTSGAQRLAGLLLELAQRHGNQLAQARHYPHRPAPHHAHRPAEHPQRRGPSGLSRAFLAVIRAQNCCSR